MNAPPHFDERERVTRRELRHALEDFAAARRTEDHAAARDALYAAARLAAELPDATEAVAPMMPVLRAVIEAAKETYDRY